MMNNTLKSPVSRFGGKFYLRDFLVQHTPQYNLYCELFCGAAHLLFAKEPSQVEIINDIDGHLINFFRVLQHSGERKYLAHLLNGTLYSREIWTILRKRWKVGDIPKGNIERAAQWYFLNRTCFGGNQLRGGFAVPSTTGRNPAQSFRTAIDTFEDIARKIRNVTIENLSYGECIQRYDSPGTLFYADPPYLNSEHYYGKDSFSQDDHRILAEIVHGVKG